MAQILKEEVRNRIIQAATDQLLKNGEAATMRQIAHAAGITPGNLYRYYENKEELVAAIIQPLVQGMDDVLKGSTGELLSFEIPELPPIPGGMELDRLVQEEFYPLMLRVLVQTSSMCRQNPRQAAILMRMESAGQKLIRWFRLIMEQALLRLLTVADPADRKGMALLADAECDAFCSGVAVLLERCSALSPQVAEKIIESYLYIHIQGISALLKRGLAQGTICLREENLHAN